MNRIKYKYIYDKYEQNFEYKYMYDPPLIHVEHQGQACAAQCCRILSKKFLQNINHFLGHTICALQRSSDTPAPVSALFVFLDDKYLCKLN